jgi:hypothetical protein
VPIVLHAVRRMSHSSCSSGGSVSSGAADGSVGGFGGGGGVRPVISKVISQEKKFLRQRLWGRDSDTESSLDTSCGGGGGGGIERGGDGEGKELSKRKTGGRCDGRGGQNGEGGGGGAGARKKLLRDESDSDSDDDRLLPRSRPYRKEVVIAPAHENAELELRVERERERERARANVLNREWRESRVGLGVAEASPHLLQHFPEQSFDSISSTPVAGKEERQEHGGPTPSILFADAVKQSCIQNQERERPVVEAAEEEVESQRLKEQKQMKGAELKMKQMLAQQQAMQFALLPLDATSSRGDVVVYGEDVAVEEDALALEEEEAVAVKQETVIVELVAGSGGNNVNGANGEDVKTSSGGITTPNGSTSGEKEELEKEGDEVMAEEVVEEQRDDAGCAATVIARTVRACLSRRQMRMGWHQELQQMREGEREKERKRDKIKHSKQLHHQALYQETLLSIQHRVCACFLYPRVCASMWACLCECVCVCVFGNVNVCILSLSLSQYK